MKHLNPKKVGHFNLQSTTVLNYLFEAMPR